MSQGRSISLGRFSVLAFGFLVALPLGAGAAPAGNFSGGNLPTLDGAGLASLAGVLTMSGAWLLARRRGNKR